MVFFYNTYNIYHVYKCTKKAALCYKTHPEMSNLSKSKDIMLKSYFSDSERL